ncbi:hypothetical protein GCM10020358_67200 [Amorphoplanes nipponensis]
MAAAADLGPPVVVKPVTGSGSAGVRLCADAGEVAEWAARLLGGDGGPTGPILVETAVRGPEFSVETFDGVVRAVVGKRLGPEPWFVEIGHDVPAPVPAAVRAELGETTRRALAALGLGWGAAHTELRLSAAGPVVIEVNPRLAGGMIPAAVRAATGLGPGGRGDRPGQRRGPRAPPRRPPGTPPSGSSCWPPRAGSPRSAAGHRPWPAPAWSRRTP